MTYQTVSVIAMIVAALAAVAASIHFQVETPEDLAPDEVEIDVNTLNAAVVCLFGLAGFGLTHAVLGAFIKEF